MDVRDVTRALVSDNSDAVRAIFPAKWGVDQVLSGTVLPVRDYHHLFFKRLFLRW